MKCARGTLIGVVLAAAGFLLPVQAASAEEAGGLTARIETQGRYYRVGDPMNVRVMLENHTEAPIPNPGGLHILANLELSGDKKPATKPPSPPAFDPSTQPRVFAPGAGYLLIVDLATVFPDLQTPGIYQLKLRSGQVESESIELMVAHPYDPDLDYAATLKTDHGDITFDLLEALAPDHVRNFVDLARHGFYTGTVFQLIAKGEVVMGGNKPGDGSSGVPYVLPPELSNVPHDRGTLCSVRTGGPDNGAQFFIDLRRKEDFDGNFTIFGKMTAGEETLKSLEEVETSGNNYQPFFKPIEDVVLRSVTITERQKTGPKDTKPEGEDAPEGGI